MLPTHSFPQDIKTRLMDKYGVTSLLEDEKSTDFLLAARVNLPLLLQRLEALLGIEIIRPTGGFAFGRELHASAYVVSLALFVCLVGR